jgi:hypothetical protein
MNGSVARNYGILNTGEAELNQQRNISVKNL